MGRKQLTPEALKKLRESAAGEIQLTPEDLEAVAGGDGEMSTELLQTWGCCNGLTDNGSTCFPCTKGSGCSDLI